METVVAILMVLTCLNFVLKQTFHKWPEIIGISVIIILFSVIMQPYAIEQNKAQIESWLANTGLMQDTAVILTLDVLVQILFSLLTVNVMTRTKISKKLRYIHTFLLWFPGLLIFPVLFSMLVNAIFTFTGTDFGVIAWSFGICSAIAVILLTIGMRLLLPEEEIRLEVLFLSGLLTAVLGVIATVNGRTTVNGTDNVDLKALLGVIGIMALGSLIGILWRRYKLNKQ